MEQQEEIRRPSVPALLRALALALPFYLILLFGFALSAADSSTESVVIVFVGPAIGWIILALVIANFWRKGWSSVWKIPLLVMIGSVFWPALFLLFSTSVRRGLLPGRPYRGAAHCVSCGGSVPVGAGFCPSCGAATAHVSTL